MFCLFSSHSFSAAYNMHKKAFWENWVTEYIKKKNNTHRSHSCTGAIKYQYTFTVYYIWKAIEHTSMDIALFLLLSFWSSSMTRCWLAMQFPLFTEFPWVFLQWAGLCGSVAAALGDSWPWLLLGLGLGTLEGLGVSGGLGWAVKAADCWDCCMWTGELWTWWMTTGEEGITSDLMVELWGSRRADVETDWADSSGASAGDSAAAAASEGLLLTGTLAERSCPFWEASVAHLSIGGNSITSLGKHLESKHIKTNSNVHSSYSLSALGW